MYDIFLYGCQITIGWQSSSNQSLASNPSNFSHSRTIYHSTFLAVRSCLAEGVSEYKQEGPVDAATQIIHSLSLPTYQPGFFVDRKDEIDSVTQLIEKVQNGQAVPERTIVFQGERGSGKSWLSLHLHFSILASLPNVLSFLVCLFPPTHSIVDEQVLLEGNARPQSKAYFVKLDDARDAEHRPRVVEEIMRTLSQLIGSAYPPGASVDELRQWLVRDVASRLQDSQQILTLLLDSAFEADWTLLELLERSFLSHLAALERVVIVITGRGNPYPWSSPYLRVQVINRRLAPFDEPTAGEQLTRLLATPPAPQINKQAIGELLSKIHQSGGGYPLSNVWLAQTPASQFSTTLNKLIDQQLSVSPATEQTILRKYFEALSVLDGFREPEMGPLLAQYFDKNEVYWSNRARAIRTQLVATNLVRWEEGRFRMDEAIRIPTESYLHRDQPALWQQLHETAFRMYLRLSEQYPEHRAHFRERAAYHERKLQAEEGVHV
jgi:hypothetical protein